MLELPVTLCRRESPALPATAWMMASKDAGDWLEEIANWPVEHAKVQIIPLRGAAAASQVVAALLIPPTSVVAPSRRCLPFAEAAPRVYVPADAEPKPRTSAAELTALLPEGYVYVWQATAGLTAAASVEILSPSQLLAAPTFASHDWSRAVPGIAFSTRHFSLEPIVTLSFESILESGRGDIGAEAEQWDDLPAAPHEPKGGFLNGAAQAGLAGAGMAFFALGFLGKLLPKLPLPTGGAAGGASSQKRNSSAPRQPSKVGAYLAQKLASVQKSLEEVRNKEVRRLLHLLANDPDQGLRFALPLGGGLHRGLAQPSGRLMERLVNFSLRGLGGGGGADYWDVSADYQRQLAERYRALANREMNLGRHRRAAYIFAELLNDLDAAAGALTAGGCFREAAVLYRERLKRPLDAARCLEQGGLWAEAIEQYAQLQMHEKIGELYATLGQPEQARAAYLTAIEEFRKNDNYVDLARIWETRLDDPDQALVELEMGWLNSPTPLTSLHSLFLTLKRLGRHDDARSRAAELVEEAADRSMQPTVAAFLAELFESYPDRSTRDAAAEGATRIIGARLRSAPPGEVRVLCSTLARLAPEDLLLGRDARRYAPAPPLPRMLIAATDKSPAKIKRLHSMSLGLNGAWRAAAASGDTFFAAGIVNGRIVVSRADSAGNVDRFVTPWPKTSVSSDARLILAADYFRRDVLGLYVVNGEPLPQKAVFHPSEYHPQALLVGAIPGSGRPLGASRGGQGSVWTVEGREGFVAVCVNDQGRLISTLRIPDELCKRVDEYQLPLPMHIRNDRLYIGFGAALISLSAAAAHQCFEASSPIRSISGSNPYTLNRIVVGMELGAAVLWDGSGHHHLMTMASDMVEPVVCINRGGYAIAATAERIEAYDTKGGKLTLAASLEQRMATPVALLPVVASDRFIILGEDGTATVFEI
jgi:tetratricopeptide (TPR) repeat protein